MAFKFVSQDEREVLYTVAKRYGISDNELRKHGKSLGIPLSPSGYWAKIYSGQQVPKPALPRVTGELKKIRTDVHLEKHRLKIHEYEIR